MQKGLLVLLLFLTTCLNAQDIDVQHYTFRLELSDSGSAIRGNATVEFKALHNLTSVTLDLTGRNGATGMEVTGIYQAERNDKRLSFSNVNDQLIISLADTIKKGATEKLTIAYWGLPDDGLIIAKNKFGERTFFADNWPNRAHHWIPCVDRPDDKASFEFFVTAPSHYSVISNGEKVEEKELGRGRKLTHWKVNIALPTKVMVIGVARFAVKTFDDSPPNLPVSAWVYPQDSTKGFYDYALATEILRFFSGYIAPFPYNKLANVQSTTIFGGMENASCIFYDEHSVTGNRDSEDLLAHEIAHQWFGDMASEKSFAHLWLSEGFATYFTDLYFEKKYGQEAVVARLKKERGEAVEFARHSASPVVDSTANLMSLLNANSYQKGAWVLHMLRNEVGDSLFQQIIRSYYQQYKGGNADTRDFEAVAEKVSGKDLSSFFAQWLYRPGIPQLAVTKYNVRGALVVQVTQKQKALYTFPIEILVEGENGKKQRYRELVATAKSSFQYRPGFAVKKVTIDPDCKLLYAAY
ncbi:M1 family metallopeptidase [Flavisolibacter nicotianae]|uniref:M1 family metallopeptidase n=1 Tax=Flavisolibacter nicotianae TaxID=2364882 RepID=UPI0013C50C88|nr:M1 family metallopeptidase [Flavisolibacter nicotianae]